MEVWKDVVGYEGLYSVSNYGRVWSNITNRILKHHNNKLGYAKLILRKDNKSFCHSIHRLVAMAFLENPNCYTHINHKDENPRNNHADNLEWCSHQYNCVYGTAIERRKSKTNYEAIADKNRIKVAQYTLSGNLIKVWRTANDCLRELGFDNSAIAKCCNGKQSQAYGFMWRYVNNKVVSKINPHKVNNKKVIEQYDLNGNFIQTWPGIREAERALKLSNSTIFRCLKGIYKTAGGYLWKYTEAS